MKRLKRITLWFLLTVACFNVLALPASASYMEHEGLEITIEMDKEVYDAGEPITATITVKNTNSGTSTISNLEQLIPEGYRLKGSKAGVQNIELRPEQTTRLEVTFEGDPDQAETTAEGFFDKLLNGETLGVPNLLWAVLLVIGFIIFMILT